jgi:hypothetical protein
MWITVQMVTFSSVPCADFRPWAPSDEEGQYLLCIVRWTCAVDSEGE